MKTNTVFIASIAIFVLYSSCQTLHGLPQTQGNSLNGVNGGLVITKMKNLEVLWQKNELNAQKRHEIYYKTALALYESLAYTGYKTNSVLGYAHLPAYNTTQSYNWLQVMETSCNLVQKKYILHNKNTNGIEAKNEQKTSVSQKYAQSLAQKISDIELRLPKKISINERNGIAFINALATQLQLSLYKTTKIHWLAAQVAHQNPDNAQKANAALMAALGTELGSAAFEFRHTIYHHFSEVAVY